MMMMSSASSSAATVAVDKATSDLLMGPDWTMNIDICDSVNSNHWPAKDVVKAVKRRLQHKSSKVQLLALTLLETMVKNCGDYVHFQIAERNILGEMVKIVKKKRSGVEFPKRSSNTAPIFTPPATHPTLNPGYGMPSNSSRRLDETMATEIESLSLSSLDSMKDVMELLSDMLQAVNPSHSAAVKDEVIVDLVNRCRSNQKKLMQMLTTTGDEELLARGLELNDCLQSLLAKHDAIALGSPLPVEATGVSPMHNEASSSNKSSEAKSPAPNISPPTPVATVTKSHIDEEEEEEDDFAQLARRHSRAQFTSPQNASPGTSEATAPVSNANVTTSYTPTASTSIPSNALALPDPPAPVKTSKEQDLIDLLSLTLSTTASSPHAPPTPPSASQHQVPVTPSSQGYPYASQTYPTSPAQLPYNSYVVPWAQPQKPSQPQVQPQPTQFQTEPQAQNQSNSPSEAQHQFQARPQPHQLNTQSQIRLQPQSQSQSPHQSFGQPQYQPYFQPQYTSAYPPPPWAATPGYFNSQNHHSSTNNMFSTPRANTTASNSITGTRPLQHNSSFPIRGTNGGAPMNGGDSWTSTGPRNPAPSSGQKPFIPSYLLFEDLNVLGNGDGRRSSTSPNLSGSNTQSMVGGRK